MDEELKMDGYCIAFFISFFFNVKSFVAHLYNLFSNSTFRLQVLQHLVDGLMSSTFKHEDLQCSFFRITVRELLACAVIRPVLNLASPR